MSPRKSSTSSADDTRSLRPRYLGVEVAGDPAVSTRSLESLLADRLRAACPDGAPSTVRVIRREGPRAVAEVEHLQANSARRAWNGHVALATGAGLDLQTLRTWGTLRGAKAWLRSAPYPKRPTTGS